MTLTDFDAFVESIADHVADGYRFGDCSVITERRPAGTRYVRDIGEAITGARLYGYRQSDAAQVSLAWDGVAPDDAIARLRAVGARFND